MLNRPSGRLRKLEINCVSPIKVSEEQVQAARESMTGNLSAEEGMRWADRLRVLLGERELHPQMVDLLVFLESIGNRSPVERITAVIWLECLESYLEGRWKGISLPIGSEDRCPQRQADTKNLESWWPVER